jgi:hypothetical protein
LDVLEHPWRRRWDSNPRYRFRYGGFQDRCLKPLDHSSARSVQQRAPNSNFCDPTQACREARTGNAARLDAGRSVAGAATAPQLCSTRLCSTTPPLCTSHETDDGSLFDVDLEVDPQEQLSVIANLLGGQTQRQGDLADQGAGVSPGRGCFGDGVPLPHLLAHRNIEVRQ